MNYPALGTYVQITEAQRIKYLEDAQSMLDRAEHDDEQNEYWARWTLWYVDTVLYTFHSVERPQLYDAINSALESHHYSEARRLIQSLV